MKIKNIMAYTFNSTCYIMFSLFVIVYTIVAKYTSNIFQFANCYTKANIFVVFLSPTL